MLFAVAMIELAAGIVIGVVSTVIVLAMTKEDSKMSNAIDMAGPDLEADNFKVNKWMLSIGFVWQLETKPHQWNNGAWFKDGELFTQRQANLMYRSVKARKWWYRMTKGTKE